MTRLSSATKSLLPAEPTKFTEKNFACVPAPSPAVVKLLAPRTPFAAVALDAGMGVQTRRRLLLPSTAKSESLAVHTAEGADIPLALTPAIPAFALAVVKDD